MTVIASYSAIAETFQQPYPIGDAMSGNPNFIGTAYLYPLSEVKALNVPMYRLLSPDAATVGIAIQGDRY